MVSVCLPSDVLLQHLLSYLVFSYLGRGVSLHGCSSKAQPLLFTLDEGYLLTATLPDLQCGIAPLGPPAPTQPRLLGRGVGPPGRRPWPRAKVRGGGREEIPHSPSPRPGATGGRRPGAMGGRSHPTPLSPRPGAVAGRTNPTSKETWLRGRKRT